MQEVTLDGDARPWRPDEGRLRITLPAGSHRIEVRWHQERGMTIAYAVPRVQLPAPAANAHLVLNIPHMQVAGNGSSNTELRWTMDRVDEVTPAAGVSSLPLWVYRVAMLVWALWLASSLVRWVAWIWRAFTEEGLWRPLRRLNSKTPPPAEPPAAPTPAG